MDVDSFRRELYVNGLDFDGQREYFIRNLVKGGKRRRAS